jgi:ATP-dependent helicase HepA
LQVFSRSVASLQYLIEDNLRGLGRSLLDAGAEAFVELATASSGPEGLIEQEISNLDRQDALDALGAPPSTLVDTLSDVDDDWRELERDTTGWVETTLLFRRTRAQANPGLIISEMPFRYEYVTQSPHTLVPLDAFLVHCRGAIVATPNWAQAVRTYPLAYHRRTAVGRQGRARQLRRAAPKPTKSAADCCLLRLIRAVFWHLDSLVRPSEPSPVPMYIRPNSYPRLQIAAYWYRRC